MILVWVVTAVAMAAMAAVPKKWVRVAMVCGCFCHHLVVCITKTKEFWEAFVLQLHQEVFFSSGFSYKG
jgi:hypothetical protein